MPFILDIFNNYLRLRSTTTPTGKLHGVISKCIYNIIFKSPFDYCYIAIQSVCQYMLISVFIFIIQKQIFPIPLVFISFFEIYEKAISLFIF